MCQSITQFEIDKYVHLSGFLDQINCEELVSELRELIEQGATNKDEQCPLSHAIHGATTFDSLLEQLTPHFETASGKRLYPTYAYARLYEPGDELKAHTDRPSCEISVTITLGFEGNVWPIYFGDYADCDKGRKITNQQGEIKNVINEREIKMNVGDAVLYRGMDKVHWREKYKEGQWQAQVFLHYVDADGPHAEWKYDKRPQLSHHKQVDYTYWCFPDAMTPEAAKKLIESLEAQVQGEDAKVGAGNNSVLNKKNS
jgi:hypothetical protein